MRHAAGQLADGFHLLELSELSSAVSRLAIWLRELFIGQAERHLRPFQRELVARPPPAPGAPRTESRR